MGMKLGGECTAEADSAVFETFCNDRARCGTVLELFRVAAGDERRVWCAGGGHTEMRR